MARLTAKEQELLDQLTAKAEAPDEPENRNSRNLDIMIDLSDEHAVARALKLGLLEPGDLENEEASEEETSEEPEPAPRRKLNLADRTMGGTK